MRRLQSDQKVFGIGLSKTGTTSLSKALNIVGIRSIHFPHDQQTRHELERANYRLSVLGDYQAITDTPVSPFFAGLDRVWPGSKFILTVREKDSWLRSADTHWNVRLAKERSSRPEFRAFVDFINACVYGCTEFDAERFSYVYDRHTRMVCEYFSGRPDDLLVLDICGGGAGWADLCGFLGVATPEHALFPHEFRSDTEWRQVLEAASGELARVVPPGETVIVVDQQTLGDEFGEGRRRLPFMELGGLYGGLPVDDNSAIDELERLKTAAGATYLAVTWPAFWWFDHYLRFIAHVESNYACVHRSEHMVVWVLHATRRADTSPVSPLG